MDKFFHFDPINLAIVVFGVIAVHVTMRNTLTWHTSWIKKHDKECDEQRRLNNALLGELRTTNAHLVTLTEAQGHRLDRVEQFQDRAAAGKSR